MEEILHAVRRFLQAAFKPVSSRTEAKCPCHRVFLFLHLFTCRWGQAKLGACMQWPIVKAGGQLKE